MRGDERASLRQRVAIYTSRHGIIPAAANRSLVYRRQTWLAGKYRRHADILGLRLLGRLRLDAALTDARKVAGLIFLSLIWKLRAG